MLINILITATWTTLVFATTYTLLSEWLTPKPSTYATGWMTVNTVIEDQWQHYPSTFNNTSTSGETRTTTI